MTLTRAETTDERAEDQQLVWWLFRASYFSLLRNKVDQASFRQQLSFFSS
jgi:hypothetical protein